MNEGDQEIMAANRLGARIALSRAMAAVVKARLGDNGEEIRGKSRLACPTCDEKVDVYFSCKNCGQALQWGWIWEHIDQCNKKEEANRVDPHPWQYVFPEPFSAIWPMDWPVLNLIIMSFVQPRELWVGLIDNDRDYWANLRKRCTEELDRRSARGIEDE